MRTLQLLLILMFGILTSLALEAAEADLYKTSKELQAKENKANKVKSVPTLAVKAPTPKKGPEVNCTTDTGETLGPKDKGLEQCLVDSKKPTKVKSP